MEYYSGGYGNPRGRKRRNPLLFLFDLLLTLLSLCVSVVTLLTYLMPYLSPSSSMSFPVLGLTAPAMYLFTLILALYWVIRWRLIRAVLMMAIVVAGMSHVSLFWRPDGRGKVQIDSTERRVFKFMTFNVRCFYADNGESSVQQVVELIRAQDPEVICFQEFNSRLAEKNEEFQELMGEYETADFGIRHLPDTLEGTPLKIYSKYKIAASGVTLTPATSVWADVVLGGDRIRIFNNHLRSTDIKSEDGAYLTNHAFISDTARHNKIRSIVERFTFNSRKRAEQADSLHEAVARCESRKIVAGDFNDTPASYVYRSISEDLNDAFAECGEGYSYTFRGFFEMLRIDFILSSEGLRTLSYEVLPVKLSDHLPVVTMFKKTDFNN